MKSKVLILVLMLLAMCVTLIASEDGSDPEEYFRKTKELDKMANKFKAETGFQGSIEYGYEQMILGGFKGNFSDIHYTSDSDTIAFRQACEKVLNKILPYSKAIRSQLSISRIRNQWSLLSTYYYQQVNGYRVEGLGFVKISYDIERKRFHIGEGTVELPEGDVRAIITPEEAEQIVVRDMNDDKYQKAKVISVFISNMGSDAYYLAYLVNIGDSTNMFWGDYEYYVDAIKGTVMHKDPAKIIHID